MSPSVDLYQLDHNPFLAGGLVLMLVGLGFAYLRRLRSTVYDFVERFFILRIEILDDDEAYHWMQLWLAERLPRTLSISVVTRRAPLPEADPDDPPPQPSVLRPTIYFVPAVGAYFFWYRRRFVTLYRDRRESSASFPLSGGGEVTAVSRDKESFTLRIFSRDRDLARQLLEECRDKAIPDDGKLDIRTVRYGAWSPSSRIRPRPLSSVILDGNQAADLLADMQRFLGSRAWYHDIGVPYRRGYLLYGPPGNGKTSVVKALAGELHMSVYLMLLSDPEMSDNRINELLAKVPERSLLLLEDIDCAFIKRKRASGREGGLTFSGLLNAIDGVASAEGRIIVMTTNHVERLDPALIRPGRADVKMLFDNATSEQAGRLFARFFPNHDGLADDFAELIADRRYSMATLQDYLMVHREDAQAALAQFDDIDRLEMNGPPAPIRRATKGAYRLPVPAATSDSPTSAAR